MRSNAVVAAPKAPHLVSIPDTFSAAAKCAFVEENPIVGLAKFPIQSPLEHRIDVLELN